MADIGLEFQPRRAEEGLRTRLNTQSPAAQEALQILSLRLPKLLAGAPISPEDTLRAGTAPGRSPTTLVEIIREALGLPAAAQTGPMAARPISAPAPAPGPRLHAARLSP